MSQSDAGKITAQDVAAMAKVARLDLGAERTEVVAPELDGILPLFDMLDAVDIGETPPTNSFDARWRKIR